MAKINQSAQFSYLNQLHCYLNIFTFNCINSQTQKRIQFLMESIKRN